MFKKLSAHTCAFDCEWAPCPVTARRLLRLPAETSDRAASEALWRHYAKPDKPDERPFLKLILCRVVSIAAVFRSVDAQGRVSLHLRAHSLAEMDEATMIVRFLEAVAFKPYQLWGFSSENADLPILRQRAIALGAPTPAFYDLMARRSDEHHLDILNVVGAYNGAAKPSLNELAVACGIPGKLETKGGDVADLYLAGKVSEIVAYNETDAVTTHLAMLRVAYQAGKLTAEQYAAETTAMREMVNALASSGHGEMGRFRDEWAGMGG